MKAEIPQRRDSQGLSTAEIQVSNQIQVYYTSSVVTSGRKSYQHIVQKKEQ